MTRLALFLGLVAIVAGCTYSTAPYDAKPSCNHVEVRDSFALGDTIPVIHVACPRRK